VAVGRPTADSVAPDTARVLSGLAALGYDGIAKAIRQALQQTGLAPHELAMRLGLPPDAVGLSARGSFIPRTNHLLRLGALLADHQPPPPSASPAINLTCSSARPGSSSHPHQPPETP